MGGCCWALSLEERRRMKKMPKPMMARRAAPPTDPPTMAPMLVPPPPPPPEGGGGGDGLGVSEGVSVGSSESVVRVEVSMLEGLEKAVVSAPRMTVLNSRSCWLR